jgi:hypothetical protein
MKVDRYLGRPGNAALFDEHPEQRQQRLTRSQEGLLSGVVANPILEEKCRRDFYRTLREEREYARRNKDDTGSTGKTD